MARLYSEGSLKEICPVAIRAEKNRRCRKRLLVIDFSADGRRHSFLALGYEGHDESEELFFQKTPRPMYAKIERAFTGSALRRTEDSVYSRRDVPSHDMKG